MTICSLKSIDSMKYWLWLRASRSSSGFQKSYDKSSNRKHKEIVENPTLVDMSTSVRLFFPPISCFLCVKCLYQNTTSDYTQFYSKVQLRSPL